MFKKILSLCLAVMLAATLCLSAVSCGESSGEFKLGVILLHDESSTYDLNFIEAINAAKEELGLLDTQVILKRSVSESNACYEAAADLVDQGCDVIFANSFGHETYLLKAAEEFPEVQFCHATGTLAHTSGLDNFHNAFAPIYEGRYLAGVAAGMKLNDMLEKGTIETPKIGYVGAFTFAEVISGYTAFYLGAKSVCPSVTMEVQFTGSWYDEIKEKDAASVLINNGCSLISQHADSMGAPSVCEEKGIPNVSYNGSTISSCPETHLISSKVNWTPYFVYICETVMDGGDIAVDYTGSLAEGSVIVSEPNPAIAAEGTNEKLEQVKADLIAGKLHVFDVSTFTVGGETLSSYMADVDTDENFEKDTEAISDGYFHESEYRSAPYFDIMIDGIELLNTDFG